MQWGKKYKNAHVLLVPSVGFVNAQTSSGVMNDMVQPRSSRSKIDGKKSTENMSARRVIRREVTALTTA